MPNIAGPKFFACCLALAVAAAAVAPGAARAQTDASEASKEELMMLFQKQKSRGLKIAAGTAVTPGAATATAGTDAAATEVAANGVTTAADGVTPVSVSYTEIDRTEQVNVRIAFDFDSAVLRDSEKPKLATLCEAMKAIDGTTFRIVGHTDAAGTDDYNEKLSLLRAEEVKRNLVQDCGLPAERLQAVGVGKRYLVNTEDPRSEENRRVEFQAMS